MFNEKILILILYGIASIFIIYKFPKYPVIILLTIIYLLLILYGEEKSLIISCIIVFAILFIINYQNSIKNNEYTIQKLDIYDEKDIIYTEDDLKIENFSNKLEKFKDKSYLSHKLKKKLNKDKKKENMSNVTKNGYFSSEGFQKDMKEYFNSFEKEGLTTRSKNWGETYKKMLIFKDKFMENF